MEDRIKRLQPIVGRIVTVILLCAAWLAPSVHGQALVQTRSWNGDIQFVHPMDGSTRGILIHTGDRLFVVGDAENEWAVRDVFDLPREPAGGVALADVTGDGRPNLIIGGEGAGATYIYRWHQGAWSLVGRTDYIWTPVRDIVTGRVSSAGREDVLVMGADGRLYLFGWAFGEFTLRWQSAPGENGPWSARIADLTGDGIDEVILWQESGYVGVWAWRHGQLVPLWENYPWGLVTALTLGDVDGDGLPDIVLTTSQGLLYAFGWRDGEFRSKRHLTHPHLPFSRLAIQRTSAGTELLAADATGLHWYRLTTQGLIHRWSSGPLEPARALWPAPGARGFLLWDGDELRLLEPDPGGTVRLVWYGRERSLRLPPIVENGVLWLGARDIAELLTWSLHWNQAARRVTIVGWGPYVIGDVGEAVVRTHRGGAALSGHIRIEEGHVYFPYDVFTALGRDVTWDELKRELVVR